MFSLWNSKYPCGTSKNVCKQLVFCEKMMVILTQCQYMFHLFAYRSTVSFSSLGMFMSETTSSFFFNGITCCFGNLEIMEFKFTLQNDRFQTNTEHIMSFFFVAIFFLIEVLHFCECIKLCCELCDI